MSQLHKTRFTSVFVRSLGLLLILLIAGACTIHEDVTRARPHLVALSVPDLAHSIEWYQNILDFDLESNDSYPDYNVSIAMLAIPGFKIEMDEHSLAVSQIPYLPDSTNPATLHGIVKLAFWVEDFARTVEQARSAGAEFISEPAVLADNSSSFILLDPSGNWIQIFGSHNE